jgi:8-oxo-dGTP diphosphatase
MNDPKALQFGRREPGKDYPDRPTAFGLALRDGKLACVLVDRGEGSYHDLPGGALDPGEDEPRALVREFAEETGLVVRAGRRFAAAAQFMAKTDGRTVNNLCAFWTAEIDGEDPGLKSEDDHAIVWLDPVEALKTLRHDAHAWAVAAWLRGR